MFARFTLLFALVGVLLTLPLSPSRADTASDIKALQAAVMALQSQVKTLQTTVASQGNTISYQKGLLANVTRVTDPTRTDGKKGTEFYITGMNLHVVNGLGATNGDPKDTGITHVNGLGNVVIGYNQIRGTDSDGNPQDVRTGSHNLIVGDEQNFSSYGGLAAGVYNTVSDRYASVTGGYGNTASSDAASVSGGQFNTASAYAASVTGGDSNTAGSGYASVTGGYANTAAYYFSSVTGGYGNTASGYYASVSGGESRTASGTYDWVAGGYFQDY